MKVLFLDYDGPVNIALWNADGTKCSYNFPKDNSVNHFQAVQWISEFCIKFGYEIVVTSTWRKSDNYAECLRNGGLRPDVVIQGRTESCSDVDYRIRRGTEIELYLKEHPDIEYYIIVDDEDIALDNQRNHFIHITDGYGFMLPDFEKASTIAYSDEEKGGSFWDRVDKIAGNTLLDQLSYELQLADIEHKAAVKKEKEARRKVQEAENAYNKELYKGKSCKFCRYSIVHEYSIDGWHNLCGHPDAPCTCCGGPCEHFKPHNAFTEYIDQNQWHFDNDGIAALENFCGDIMSDRIDNDTARLDKAKKIVEIIKTPISR